MFDENHIPLSVPCAGTLFGSLNFFSPITFSCSICTEKNTFPANLKVSMDDFDKIEKIPQMKINFHQVQFILIY